MKAILSLIERMKQKHFADRYPEYQPDDGKVHVLYYSVPVSGVGLYRFILPYLHLNESTTHSAIIFNMVDWHGTSRQESEAKIDVQLLHWADYVVFPTISSDLKPLLIEMLKVNPKLLFAMDIDDNIHELPPVHPGYSQVTNKMKVDLQNNISAMEFIISPSLAILDYYEQFNKQGALLHNLISPYLFSEIRKTQFSFEKIRIGMVVNEIHWPNVYPFRHVLKAIRNKYKDKIEFINIGWDGKYKGKDAFAGLNVTIIPAVPFVNYFETVRNQCFDLALIPLSNQPQWNKYKSFQRWLEYAAWKVPVIVGNSSAYYPLNTTYIDMAYPVALVADNKQEWINHISTFIDGQNIRQNIGESANRLAFNYYSWTNKEALSNLQEIFS